MRTNRSKKKLQLRVQIENIGDSFPETNLQQVVNWLHAKQVEFITKGYTNLELCFDDGGWDAKYDMVFYGVREETDKEYEKRTALVQKEKNREQEELKEHKRFIENEAKKLGITG